MAKENNEYSKKRKKENYYKEAKKINVRARSYFKLQQINIKYNLIKNNQKIIDLGAAPGGWLEYIDKKLEEAEVIGIDLLEIKKPEEFSENIKIIEDNFDNIKDHIEENTKFDLVLSDMAPEFSGNSQVDRGRTHKLNMQTLEFCKQHLKAGANALFKSFEGEDLELVRKRAKEIFGTIKEYKPHSSQTKTSEMFVVCFRKK